MRDQELRDQLTSWARPAEQQPVPDIAVLRDRLRRRRLRIGGATAGLATAGVTIGLVLAQLALWAGAPGTGSADAGAHHGHHPLVKPQYPVKWYPAGPLPPADASPSSAPYVVTVNFTQARPSATIVDWVTGQVIATVRPPRGQGFEAASAAGDDRTFVLAALGQANGVSATGYYELRLAADGEPLPLSQLPVQPGQLSTPDSFAISPDGRRLAISTVLDRRTSVVAVTVLATGKTRSWRTADPGNVSQLTWAGNRQLVFDWTANPASVASPRASGLRLLDTDAAGTDLMAARLVISQSAKFNGYTGESNALASADGSTIFLTMGSSAGGNPLAEVVQFSLTSGQPERAVTPPVGVSGHGTFCAAVWSDPSGQQLAADCGPSDQGTSSDGTVTQRDLHIPAPMEFGLPRQLFVAW